MVAKKTLQKKWPDIELTIADNGKLGIEAFQAGEFDIILMDIMMPIMDGYEATQFIRNNLPPEKGSLPILAMTAHTRNMVWMTLFLNHLNPSNFLVKSLNTLIKQKKDKRWMLKCINLLI